MGYPPVFTGVWDVTFPPDTQLANQLGADLRSLRVDVMQRMALLSGTFANRPTPETINATWGGAGFGLLYFSTDNNKIYQWSGSAWADITSSVGGGSIQTVADGSVGLDIPANTLQVGDVLDITMSLTALNGVGGSTNGYLQFSGTPLGTLFSVAHPSNPAIMARARILIASIGAIGTIFTTCDYVPGAFPTSVQKFNVDTTSPINVIGIANVSGGATVSWGPLSVVRN